MAKALVEFSENGKTYRWVETEEEFKCQLRQPSFFTGTAWKDVRFEGIPKSFIETLLGEIGYHSGAIEELPR